MRVFSSGTRMSLVNVSLKLETLILQIHCFFVGKCEILTFFQQQITVYLII